MTDEMIHRILVATDGSEKNRSALDEGIKVARAFGATVYAVYVIDTRSLTAMATDIPIGDSYPVVHAEAKQAFDRIRAIAGDVSVETAVREGHPAAEVVKFAVANNIDLIVIGTRGKMGLERLLLGSVAEEIIRSAPCKVLVVK